MDSRNNWKNWVCYINFFSSHSLLHPFQSCCFLQHVANTPLCQYPQWWLSLVVQRLRTHLRMQGTWFNSWSGKIPHDSGQLSPCAATTEACMPWSPCSTTREATTVRSPRTATGEQPPLSATRESLWAASKTQHSQKERKKKIEAKKKKIEAILKERKKIPRDSHSVKSNDQVSSSMFPSLHRHHTWRITPDSRAALTPRSLALPPALSPAVFTCRVLLNLSRHTGFKWHLCWQT